MPTERQFRLYPYDNFTRPIPALLVLQSSSVELFQLDEMGGEIGDPVAPQFQLADDASHLRLSLPDGMRLPIELAVRLKFEGRERPDLFNFTFGGASVSLESDANPRAGH